MFTKIKTTRRSLPTCIVKSVGYGIFMVGCFILIGIQVMSVLETFHISLQA